MTKNEFVLRDAIGRDWQCGTYKYLNLPERLGASYVEKDKSKKVPTCCTEHYLAH